ncbi:unnamed protein product [Schistocephalus solidus]|uniref:MENTAL domain-containing protein n=1 Tax=Schistocephalus solidus TaxID=70667 RepID=A0A183SWP4_SCHSO|nr:unnamed protein product [Schistocephalus solidus]
MDCSRRRARCGLHTPIVGKVPVSSVGDADPRVLITVGVHQHSREHETEESGGQYAAVLHFVGHCKCFGYRPVGSDAHRHPVMKLTLHVRELHGTTEFLHDFPQPVAIRRVKGFRQIYEGSVETKGSIINTISDEVESYKFVSSLFDVQVLAACRFTALEICYGCVLMSSRWPSIVVNAPVAALAGTQLSPVTPRNWAPPSGHTLSNRPDKRAKPDNPRSNQPLRRMALVARELARYKVDITALRETCFSELGQLEEVGTGYTFCWSVWPKADRRDADVAFAFRSDIAGPLPQDVNDHLMILRLPL